MSPVATESESPAPGKLGIPNGTSGESQSSKTTSPTDSEDAEKKISALGISEDSESAIGSESDEAKHPLVIHAAKSAGPDLSADPLSATALIASRKLDWDSPSYFTTLRATVNNMSSVLINSDAPSTSLHWQAFKLTGPRFPLSLEKLIMDYHHKKSKSWQLAHDMGSGSGLYSPVLAKYFRHVHISEPKASSLAKSRKAMSAWSVGDKRSRRRFTFSVGKAEQGHEAVADGTVDLAIMVEGAHVTNADEMVRSAAQSLSPNGTLALVSYSPMCRVLGNPRANEAVQSLLKKLSSQMWQVVCGDVDRQKQFSTGLDFVPLPEDLFDISRTRRVTINTHGKGNAAFHIPTVEPLQSKVLPGERCQDFSSEYNDEQAKGWRQEVGPELFRSITAALTGARGVQKFEQELRTIQKIMHETSENGLMVTVEWSAAAVLATRK